MAGGLEDAQDDVPDLDLVALARRLGVLDLRSRVRPVPYGRAGAFGEDRGARDHVFVAMGFENVGDTTVTGSGELDVDVAVASGVDDRGLAVAAQHVGQVGEALALHFFDEHALRVIAPPRFARTCADSRNERRVAESCSADVGGPVRAAGGESPVAGE